MPVENERIEGYHKLHAWWWVLYLNFRRETTNCMPGDGDLYSDVLRNNTNCMLGVGVLYSDVLRNNTNCMPGGGGVVLGCDQEDLITYCMPGWGFVFGM